MNYLAVDIGATFGSPFSEITSVGGLVSTIVNLALVVAGLIFLFLFVMGGIGIISGAGSDSPERAAKGKQAITTAVLGFVVVFAAYWIVKLIEVITGISILG